jgi:hypothetical protein
MPDYDRAERRAFVSSVMNIRISEMAIFYFQLLRTYSAAVSYISSCARTHPLTQTNALAQTQHRT